MRVVDQKIALNALSCAVQMIAQADRYTLAVPLQSAWLGYNIGYDIIQRLIKRRERVAPSWLPSSSPAYLVLEDAATGLTYTIRWIAQDRYEDMVRDSGYMEPDRGYFPVVQIILDVITSDSVRNQVVASARDSLLELATELHRQPYAEARESARRLEEVVKEACDSRFS